MPIWNQCAEEVHAEQQRGFDARLPALTSYKAQALRELAHRLVLEERIQELKQELRSAYDRLGMAEDHLRAIIQLAEECA